MYFYPYQITYVAMDKNLLNKAFDQQYFKEQYEIFDNETIVEIIDMYLTSIDDYIRDIDAAIAAKDIDTLEAQVHKLKGSTSQFTKYKPYELLVAFLTLSRFGVLAGADGIFAEIKISLNQLCVELKEMKKHYE